MNVSQLGHFQFTPHGQSVDYEADSQHCVNGATMRRKDCNCF
jgi:hypothetical protein